MVQIIFFLENRVVLNFDFRHGAKKSGHLDQLLQSYGKIHFNIFRYIFMKRYVPLVSYKLDVNIFVEDLH